MSEKILRPDPGIYPGIEMDDYHAWEAASNSRLSRLMKSPAHLRTYIETPQADTSALAFGRAAHVAILEPDSFRGLYATASQCIWKTKKGDRCSKGGTWPIEGGSALCSTHLEAAQAEGLVIDERVQLLSEQEFAACLAMRDSVMSMKRAAGMLSGDGEVEISIAWNDPRTGVRCKGRLDRHSPDLPGGAIVDLKTTRSASRLDFERAIFSFGYHRQGAMYSDGAREVGIEAKHYVIIAVEKEPPYGVGIFRLTEGAIGGGREQLQPLLGLYSRIQDIPRADWWAYPDEVRDVSLPAYAWNQLTEQVEDAAA